MGKHSTHPAQRFAAPGSIQKGVPLKELMGWELVALIAESLADVAPGFDRKRFTRLASRGLEMLELKERAAHIALAMAGQLPANFDDLTPLLIRSLGPPLTTTERNGLAPFFYLPHSQLIGNFGVESFESGMTANYELTRRFTAEFSIRPFLVRHQAQCLDTLAGWVKDPDPHVRRLVSEGTRPRLPWSMRLPAFQANPRHTLPLLEALKDDPELYVRRSVANHLGDIAKDNPGTAFRVCESWLDTRNALDDPLKAGLRWVVRHALRHPARIGNTRAIRIRARAERRA